MAEFMTPRLLGEIAGRCSADKCTKLDIESLIAYIDFLEDKMDETDECDFFGTEGWRHYFGLED